jgi:serine/threonine protein kinase
VRLFRTFEARGHYCLAFEKLGPSLFSALKSTRGLAQAQPSGAGRSERSVVRAGIGSYFTLPQIASIAADCFEALEHIHSIRLTHTDLKPENILLVAPLEKGSALPAHPRVALIDFGGATWQHEHHSSVVCTRQYRPPEVTLGLEWNHSVDQWSMGCILAELWTGALLFSTHDEVEHLALMERTLGALPRCMLRAATCMRAERNFRHGYLRWPERALDRDSEEHVRARRRLRERVLEREQVLEPCVHAAPLRMLAASVRSLRAAVTSEPNAITTSTHSITRSSGAPSHGANAGLSAAGATARYTHATVIRNIRCCFAIGPRKSLGNPSDRPSTRT